MATGHRTPLTEEEKAAKRAYNRRYRQTPRGAASFAWNRLTSRAGDRYNSCACYMHVEVRMTRADFMAWAIPEYDRWFREHRVRRTADEIPSIDRIDVSGHYELGNIRLISWRANRKLARTINTDAPQGTRWCPGCRQFIHLGGFYHSKPAPRQPSGLSVYCKPCTDKKQKQWREKAGDRGRAVIRARRSLRCRTPAGAATIIWGHIQERSPASIRLSQEEFFAWAIPELESWFAEHRDPPTIKRINHRDPWSASNLILVPQCLGRLSANRDAPAGTRFCPICRQFLSLDAFYRTRGKSFGYCKPCASAKRAESR